MISKQMIDWGESGCSIREIAAYGERRAAEIGPENVYNFAIGNPSIDPPDCVHAAVERLLRTVPPTQLHAYAPAPGMASVREKVAAYLADTFGEAYRARRAVPGGHVRARSGCACGRRDGKDRAAHSELPE